MAKQAKIIDCQCPCSPRSIGFSVAGKKYTVYAGHIRQMVPTARKGEVRAQYLPRPSTAVRAVALQLVVKDIYGLDVDFNRLSARDFLDKVIGHVRGIDKEAAKGGVYMANAMVFCIPNVKGIYLQIWSSDDGACRLMTDISDSYCTDRMDAVRAVCLWMSFQLQKPKKQQENQEHQQESQPGNQEQQLCEKPGLTETKDEGLGDNPPPTPPAKPAKDVPAAVRGMLGKATGSIVDYELAQSATDMEMVTSRRFYVQTALGEADAIARKTADGHWAVYVNLAGKSAEGVAIGRQAAIDLGMADLCKKLGLTEKKDATDEEAH